MAIQRAEEIPASLCGHDRRRLVYNSHPSGRSGKPFCVAYYSTVYRLIPLQDPNTRMESWWETEPLSWAASHGQLGALVRLIQMGADPLRPPDTAGETPYSYALRDGHAQVSALLDEFRTRIKAAIDVGGGGMPQQALGPTFAARGRSESLRRKSLRRSLDVHQAEALLRL